MLWPTTTHIESHWSRADRRIASSAARETADQVAWPGQRGFHQEPPAQPSQPAGPRIDPGDAKFLPATLPDRLRR